MSISPRSHFRANHSGHIHHILFTAPPLATYLYIKGIYVYSSRHVLSPSDFGLAMSAHSASFDEKTDEKNEQTQRELPESPKFSRKILTTILQMSSLPSPTSMTLTWQQMPSS